MERQRIELDIETLTISEAKAAYIESAKGVIFADVLEVLGNAPRFFQRQTEHGVRYAILGPNQAGRFMVVGVAPEGDRVWRVVTAYWISRARGRRMYEEG